MNQMSSLKHKHLVGALIAIMCLQPYIRNLLPGNRSLRLGARGAVLLGDGRLSGGLLRNRSLRGRLSSRLRGRRGLGRRRAPRS